MHAKHRGLALPPPQLYEAKHLLCPPPIHTLIFTVYAEYAEYENIDSVACFTEIALHFHSIDCTAGVFVSQISIHVITTIALYSPLGKKSHANIHGADWPLLLLFLSRSIYHSSVISSSIWSTGLWSHTRAYGGYMYVSNLEWSVLVHSTPPNQDTDQVPIS